MEILDVGDEFVDFLHDESRREGRAEKICFPQSTGDVQEAVRLAAENDWPVTVQGGRTGITGGAVPEGGLILNLSRMKAIGGVGGDRMVVQPGAVLAEIRTATQGSGMFFPSDLTETTATIGGMVANNASGARSFKYGAVRNWIDALEVVLPNGEVARVERDIHKADGLSFKLGSAEGQLPDLRPPDVKSAAGYVVKPDMDLVDLFIGAEGTLGIVTGVTLKLLPKPGRMNGLTAFWDSEGRALEFVRFLREHTAPVAIEFFDCNALELLRRMKSDHPVFSDLPELKPDYHTAIYFEYDTDVPDHVVSRAGQAIDCWFSEGEHEIATLKNFRHAIPESVNLLIGERKQTMPGLTKLGTDMSVPDDRLEDSMRMYHEGLNAAGLEYVIFGHVGNNHVHVNILPRSMEEYERGKALYLAWAKLVVEWGGSVSAEHGIGKIKTDFLRLMVGSEGVEEMKRVKRLFDPSLMLNPGNLFF
jgi:D-lactate dehydrogenase (cytochrome)